MTRYLVVDDMKKQEFEKEYQLPYGCWNALIYNDVNVAIQFLKHMTAYKRVCYNIERWENGSFVEVVITGRELV